MKRRPSDLHPFPSNWVNASRELQFDCNECNFIFVKLNTFNTHMKKKKILSFPGKTQNYSPWATVSREPTTWNKCNFIVTNAIFYLKN